MKTLTDFTYEHVLVLGLAKSGTAAANVLLENGIDVRVNDFYTGEDDPIVQELRKKGAEVVVGSHPISMLDGMEAVVKNPGIPYDNVIVQEAEKRNLPIITEVEISSKLAQDNDLIGITGSNGKTTTTTLVAEMLKTSGQKIKLAGNIGVASIEVAQELEQGEKLLLELSSFQLMGIETFKPHTAALLNLYEAHLDYHGTFANYMEAKTNIYKNQTKKDFLVYNSDDSTVREVVTQAESNLVPFSVREVERKGAYIDNGKIWFKQTEIIDLEEVVLVGEHNLENILAAVCLSMLNGATVEGIQAVLKTFGGVRHRLQFVDNINGRLFYNDSKATNILATEKALNAFEEPTILLAGGLDRGNSFDELLPSLKHVKAMVVFGETASKLEELAKSANIKQVAHARDVQEAAKTGYALSDEGDVILLSPACASWDQYKTFEERGDMFVHAVHILA